MENQQHSERIETTEHGSRLPDRTYFPCYLGNGVDGMLINLMGSGICRFGHAFDYSAPLTGQKAKGWYKADRRTRRNTELVYGRMLPLFEFASAPVLHGEQLVPRDCKQYFDPRRATLTTFYEQYDNRTLERVRVRVTSFLTKDHVLVEHYLFEEAPAAGVSLRFYLNTPSEDYLEIHDRAVTMDRAEIEDDRPNGLLRYRYACDAYSGGAFSWVDCPAGDSWTLEGEGENVVGGCMETRKFGSGESFTRYLAAIDNHDADEPEPALETTLEHCRDLGRDALRERHEAEWEAYFATCRVELPDPALRYLYDVSRYFLRANLHPSGFLPMGLFPYLWQGVMFWDAGFAVQAWNGTGNTEEARRVLEHLSVYREEGHREAQRFGEGARGMRLQWTFTRDRFVDYPQWTQGNRQIHNNGWWAHVIHTYYEATGDRAFLERTIGVMGELLLFLCSRFVEDRGDHAVITECMGVDESRGNLKFNDTWTLATTLRGLMDYRRDAEALGVEPVIDDLPGLITKLQAGLEKNVDENGVLQSFEGCRLPHWGSLVFDLFPDHPALQPTLRRMMDNHDPEMDLYNFHGVTRYAEKSFPWGTFWAARCFARAGDPRALDLIECETKAANYFGGLPERVFYHGERFNNWFLTAHASLIWAVNGVLANAANGTLRVFAGARDSWRDAAFEGIFAGEGLVVSARMEDGVVTRLIIDNRNPDIREINCLVGTDAEPMVLTLEPGENRPRLHPARA